MFCLLGAVAFDAHFFFVESPSVPIFGLDGQVVLGVFFVAFVWWGRTLALDARTSQKGTLPKIRRR